jgi:tetratricopeptide (TPR) repeat protein
MKKLVIAVVLLLSVNAVFSQKYEKKIADSDKKTADPKKSLDPKTWISRGELFYQIANEPVLGLVAGMDETTYKMVLASVTEQVTEKPERVGDKEYSVHSFPDKKVYFLNGVIAFWDVLKYEVSDPFSKSFEAYKQAKSLDAQGKNNKKIGQRLKELSTIAKNEAFNQYQLGRNDKALALFSLSLDCTSDPTVGETDSLIYYYAGVIATDLGENATAEKYLRKAIEIGYVENGSTYAALAEVLTKSDKKEEARLLLEKGMTVNPENQSVIFGLINNYMSSGRDPKDIIPLIKTAQEKESSNASLYYAEGNLYEKLEDFDNALKSYEKSVEIDPNYFFGYFGIGIIYFNKAAKLDEQAIAEKDNKKYEELVSQADAELKKSLPYLEKAYSLNNADNQKIVIQALKDINFRFRNENEKFKADAEKYAKMLE